MPSICLTLDLPPDLLEAMLAALAEDCDDSPLDPERKVIMLNIDVSAKSDARSDANTHESFDPVYSELVGDTYLPVPPAVLAESCKSFFPPTSGESGGMLPSVATGLRQLSTAMARLAGLGPPTVCDRVECVEWS